MREITYRFDLHASRTAAVWLGGVHGGGILAVWGSAVPAEAAGALSMFAAWSFVRELRLHALRSARSAVVRMVIGSTLRIGLADGRTYSMQFRARPFVHARLAILRLASDERRATVVVFPDALRPPARHKDLRRCIRPGVQT